MDFNARIFTTLIKTIVLLSLSDFLLVCNGIQSDFDCLKSIKVSLEDPFNYLSSWQFNNHTEGFICTFTGIDCWHGADENRVLNIRLSDMGLKGQFPRGIQNCTSLTGLDLSNNKLFGPIPSDISRLIPFVTSLDLSSNNFAGDIPRDIANLSYLNVFKLDSNHLTGNIPPEIGFLNRMKTFSVVNNKLSGPVPVFENLTVPAESYANNGELCGGPLPSCKAHKKNNYHAFFISGFMVGWSGFTVLFFGVGLFYLPNIPLNMLMSRRKKKNLSPVAVQLNQWPTTKDSSEDFKISKLEKYVTRCSLTELRNGTDNFSEDKVIGLGKTGTMYKAVLPNGCFLAVKRFYNSQCLERHLETEITILGRLRHINIVTLLGFCYETEDRLLVYKYMPNGNLYDWLHSPHGEAKIMNWPLRVKIAVGIARGLAWLHHCSKYQVIHHNINSKCVILDQNFEPKISNFGQAQLMNSNESTTGASFFVNGELLEIGFNKKDVYGFGVVLLELVTGKEPSKTIESSVCAGNTLVDWIINLSVSSNSFYLCDVIDNSLIGQGFDDEIFQFLNVARKCVQSIPDRRPPMLHVYRKMRSIGEKHGLVDDLEM